MYRKAVMWWLIIVLVRVSPLGAATADELLKAVGENAGDWFGHSVSSAGDVNGDGYDDIIVGAYGSNAAYIFYGGPSMDANYDVKLVGENGRFGYSVSSAGDVNGDGYDDVIVGADYYDDGSNTAVGAAYIFYGGPSMDSIYDVKMVGENTYDNFGTEVSSAGDVNNDGYDDVIVGAYRYDNGSNTNDGAAYIFYGGPSMDSIYDVKMVGENAGDYFGLSVSSAGDVNNDGYDDVIVGAEGSNAAYIFYGGSSMDSIYDVKMVGENADDWFGNSVSSAGDVNKDGYDDVIVGADGYAVGSNTNAGAVYIFYGGHSMDSVYDAKMVGENADDRFGYSVSSAGDINGDGYDDVIVGAFYYNNGVNSHAGAAYIFYGGPSMDSVYDAKMVGENTGDWFGYSVSSAGDINGDGYDDVIVGAHYYDDGSNNDAGAAYIYDFYLYKLIYPNGGEHLIVGSQTVIRWLGENHADIYLSADGGNTWNLLIDNAYGGNGETLSVSIQIPYTPTGFAKIAVCADSYTPAAEWYSDASDSFFSILIPYAPTSVSFEKQIKATGENADDWFGYSVSSAGDVNGDGYDDFVVSAPYHTNGSNSYAGAVYIFYGGPSMDANYDVKLVGENVYDNFGYSVSSAGDVNKDGYDDIIVGAPYYDDGSNTDAGAVYIFYGGPTMDSSYDVKMVGENAGCHLGYSVSSAGDVNHDGYDDVIVGAPDYDDGSNTYPGAAYIFYGGPSMDVNYDVKMMGEDMNDLFGNSVSSAGDLNNDGYDDVIVGAYYYDNGLNYYSGAAYIFYGGPSMDASYDVKMVGENTDDEFGSSVSVAGDLNNDGYNDVIVGARNYDDGSNTAVGAIYIYNFYMYQLISPNGGEVWNVGSKATVKWKGERDADIYISVDGGNRWDLLVSDAVGSGSGIYTYSLLVPHIPTRYALLKVVKVGTSPDALENYAVSDTFFTIKSTVNLLAFSADPEDDGKVHLTWRTDPGLKDLSGYNLYRIDADGHETRVNTELIKSTEYTDEPRGFITGYALGAVNGLGEEYRIGEIAILSGKKAISVLPKLVRDEARIVFYVPALSPFSTKESAVIRIVDLAGRTVIKEKKAFKPGMHMIKLNLSELKRGVYYAVLEVGSGYMKVSRFEVAR